MNLKQSLIQLKTNKSKSRDLIVPYFFCKIRKKNIPYSREEDIAQVGRAFTVSNEMLVVRAHLSSTLYFLQFKEEQNYEASIRRIIK